MSWHRSQTVARLENGVTEGLVGGGSMQLVTVCLSDDGVGEISDDQGRPLAPAPQVVSYLRPSEARTLAFELLALAEHAERRSEQWR
jgi:hypothetical protein